MGIYEVTGFRRTRVYVFGFWVRVEGSKRFGGWGAFVGAWLLRVGVLGFRVGGLASAKHVKFLGGTIVPKPYKPKYAH